MKFKIGQVVKHKISNRKYVITKCYPRMGFRRYPYYRLDDDVIPCGIYGFESEFTEIKI